MRKNSGNFTLLADNKKYKLQLINKLHFGTRFASKIKDKTCVYYM